ncbi:DeoR family transcriptional regulator [Actinotignum urinale]|uniref:DeoR family transcriptional regulator n=1 Tax=Actinotignum urinale TaxID=190146 RepID=A0ABU5G9K2_9ACTO|nr:DeoR family transcriptional regulator [Actinotignum urinale]MDY5133392.1 DeoR family transcriptional regulator [Actinotignum urinale]
MDEKIEAKLSAPPSKQNLRRDAITERVLEVGFVRIDTLVDELDVSRMTVHRDLDALEARGVLRKSRGVVTAVASSLFEASTDYRLRQQSAEKRAIANLAFDLIEPGEAIVLDDFTTGLNLAELLRQKEPLTVITN